MKNYCYLFETELLLKIDAMNVILILNKMHDIVFNKNNIFNNFLKIIKVFFAKIIAAFI